MIEANRDVNALWNRARDNKRIERKKKPLEDIVKNNIYA
jgi:hypothetical protein